MTKIPYSHYEIAPGFVVVLVEPVVSSEGMPTPHISSKNLPEVCYMISCLKNNSMTKPGTVF